MPMSFWVMGSSKRRPISRLMAKKVNSGLVTRLALRGLADEALAIGGESHDRRGRSRAFRVLDDFGGCSFHDRDAGIRRAEVDANHFRHYPVLPFGQRSPGLPKERPPVRPHETTAVRG